MMQIGDLLTAIPEDSLIQITLDENAADFVIPWNLLNDSGGFWGLRYRIDQLIIAAQTLRGLKESMNAGPSLDFGLFLGTLAQGPKHRENIEQLLKRAKGGQTNESVITTRDQAYAYLAECKSHVVYVFSHGLDGGAAPGQDPWLELQAGRLSLSQLRLQDVHLIEYPIVVLNACESGQVVPDRSVSFVHFFLDRGARAVVATECVMRPGFAAVFAEALLERMFLGEELGAAVVALRRQYLTKLNPLALAYTVYGRASTRFDPALLAKLAS